jgi:predicted DNA-binding protein with PD1-like motif
MMVRPAHRTRHLVIRLDPGDEIPAALVRALDESEARSGFFTGTGAVDAAILHSPDRAPRRLEGPLDLLSLSGTIATHAGATTVQLSALLSRETDLGLSTTGGPLAWARARAVEIHVVVLDDLALTRVEDPATGATILDLRPAATSALARPAAAPEPPRPAPEPQRPAPEPQRAAPEPQRPPPPPAREPIPTPPAGIQLPTATGPTQRSAAEAARPGEAVALPQKPQRPKDDLETYPEVGDTVMHFHFGECTVISSDGDRIRLRQDRDGRVREVALTMLRIELDQRGAGGEDSPRHFKLHRKN